MIPVKPKKRRRLVERGLHQAIWNLLRLRGVLAWTFHNERLFVRRLNQFMPNTPDRPPGIPDIICKMKNGPCFWIEVKAKRGTVSPHQKKRHEELKEWGWPVFVCRTLEDVDAVLKTMKEAA